MKNMNKLSSAILFFILATACSQNKNTFNIQEDVPITLNSQFGEIKLSLRNNSILLEKIDIYDSEELLLFTQSFDDEDMISTKFRSENDDSDSYKTYKSFLTEMERQRVNDTLTKEIYHSLLTTRELKNSGDLLYLDMY
jgi:hypothetical protein